MLNFHGIWACFLFDIKKLLRSSRFYMTILVVCFVIWDHLAPISTWLAAQHYKITPVSYTHLDVYKRQSKVSVPRGCGPFVNPRMSGVIRRF